MGVGVKLSTRAGVPTIVDLSLKTLIPLIQQS